MITKRPIHNKRRHRSNGRKGNFLRNGYDNNSNSRPKGSVSKILEKYLNLAQDAQSNGDRIKAEGFFQHAEHYQRLMNSNLAKLPQKDLHNKDEVRDEKVDDDEKEINGKNKTFSRTQRAEKAKSRRVDSDKIKSHNLEKKEPFTSDGVEALKAFSGSINEAE